MRVVVAGWVGSTNLGDELVFAGLRGKLAGHNLTAISVDPVGTTLAHGVAAVSDRDLAGVWGAIGRADAVVLGGGGLIQDQTSQLNLPYHLSRGWLASLRGRPWAAVGVGAGALRTPLGRRLARSLRQAAAISVRDQPSADLLAELGVDQVTVAADLALALATPEPDTADRLAVSLRPWSGRDQRLPVALRRRPHPTPLWALAEAAAALDEAAQATGLAVRFVAFDRRHDHPFHEEVASRMRTPTECVAPGIDEVVGEVAASQVVVGMRYHAGIAAILGGRPTVLIGYAPKVDALAGELGPGGALLPWRPGGYGHLAAAVTHVLPRSAAVVAARERLRERERGNDAVLERLLDGA